MAKKPESARQNTVLDDPEFKALDACVNAIKPLNQGEANRVIAYLRHRFTEHRDFS